MNPSRLRRLNADYEKVLLTFNEHPYIKLVQSDGQPPEKYTFEFHVKSLVPSVGNEHKVDVVHRAEVFLPMDYPRRPPFCRMTTPVFHLQYCWDCGPCHLHCIQALRVMKNQTSRAGII